MREWSKNNIVIISEQEAPDDFEILWEGGIRRTIKKDDNSLSDRREPIIRRGNIGKDYDCVKKFLKESSLEERELFLLSQKQIYDDIVSNLKANSRGEKNV